MGEDVKDFGPGGGRRPGLQHGLQVSHTGNPIVWFRELDYDPPDQTDPQGFHHRVARILAGMKLQKDTVGRCWYPTLGAVMAEAVLEKVDTYIFRR